VQRIPGSIDMDGRIAKDPAHPFGERHAGIQSPVIPLCEL
jgi:hypothetical protein